MHRSNNWLAYMRLTCAKTEMSMIRPVAGFSLIEENGRAEEEANRREKGGR